MEKPVTRFNLISDFDLFIVYFLEKSGTSISLEPKLSKSGPAFSKY